MIIRVVEPTAGTDPIVPISLLASLPVVEMMVCIAEALLRIPDGDTQEALIRDEQSAANCDAQLGRGRSVFVIAFTDAEGGRVTGSTALSGVPANC